MSKIDFNKSNRRSTLLGHFLPPFSLEGKMWWVWCCQSCQQEGSDRLSSVSDRTEVKPPREVVQCRIANITDYVGEKECTRVIQISLYTAKINPETTTHKQIRMTALQKSSKKWTPSDSNHTELQRKISLATDKHCISHSFKEAERVAKGSYACKNTSFAGFRLCSGWKWWMKSNMIPSHHCILQWPHRSCSVFECPRVIR